MPQLNYKVIDLFAGCGGLSLGFQNAGFNIVAAFDNWDEAIDIYTSNFSHPIIKRDLSDVDDLSDLRKFSPDIIIGGPPCQDYSSAGHRNENLGRAALTINFAEIIISLKPRFFVMENVPNIQKSEKLSTVLDMFVKSGYGISKMVLDASMCGVPQRRRRFIVIGGLGCANNFLDELLIDNQSSKSMTLRDYFGDTLGFEYYFRVPRSYSRRGIFSIDEPSMTIRGVDRPVPSGYLGHPNDPVPLTSDIRTLTPHERSLIQTFPADFKWGDRCKTNLNQAIGNAVPVKLAEYIAKCLKTFIYEKSNNS